MDRDWTSETIVSSLSRCLKTNFWWSKIFFSGKAVIRIGSMKISKVPWLYQIKTDFEFMNKQLSGRPLDSGSLQPVRNDEDLDQSALTKAHGDRAGKKLTIRKLISGNEGHFWWCIIAQNPSRRKNPEALGRMGSRETVGKALRWKAGPALQNRWNIGGILRQ